MSDPNAGTAVAVAKATGVGALPAHVQHQLALRKMQNAVAAELAKTSWGQMLDQDTRRAVADWGRRYQVDVTREIDVLGGRIYLNVNFYNRKLSELVSTGMVVHAYPDHIEVNEELDALAKAGEAWAIEEQRRRRMERIIHNIPPSAKAAVVYRVKLAHVKGREFTGVKWAGGRGKNPNGKFDDPIGEKFPSECAESRSARRCLRQIVTHVPSKWTDEIEAIEVEAETLSAKVTEQIAATEQDVQTRRGVPQLAREPGDESETEVDAHGIPVTRVGMHDHDDEGEDTDG